MKFKHYKCSLLAVAVLFSRWVWHSQVYSKGANCHYIEPGHL